MAVARRELRHRRLVVGFAVGASLTIALVLFIVQNGYSIHLKWLFFDFEMRVWVALALTFVLGVVAWELMRRTSAHLRTRRAKELEAFRAVRNRRSRQPRLRG